MGKIGYLLKLRHGVADHEGANHGRMDAYRFMRAKRAGKVYCCGYADVEAVHLARRVHFRAGQAQPVCTLVQLGDRLMAGAVSIERKLNVKPKPLGQNLFFHRKSNLAPGSASFEGAARGLAIFDTLNPLACIRKVG
jgi:hypothetical protein